MACMSPLVGTRASGTALVTAESADVTLPIGTYAIPVMVGQHRGDLAVKVGEGPNSDKSWTVTSAGTTVDMISNLGGSIYNFTGGERLIFDPPVPGIASAKVAAAWSGGAGGSSFGTVRSLNLYETFGTNSFVDLVRSRTTLFPAVMIAWAGSEPADGSAVSQVSRGTRVSATGLLFREEFNIQVFTSRSESEQVRRMEGLYILDRMTELLTDRHAVDGVPFSLPSGLQITSRYRVDLPQDQYQKVYIYGLTVSAMRTLQRDDDQTFSLLEIVNLDVLKPQDPALPNQGDYTVVDDVKIDMTP
jgi:hypothetical protein